MPRPDFPHPYSPLPAEVIMRINEEQEYYDRDPERAEREQREREERRMEEQRQEEEAYLEYLREQEETDEERG